MRRVVLVRQCKYGSILYGPFLSYLTLNNIVTLKYGNLDVRSLKIIQTGTIRKLEYGFLFAFHRNYGRIFNHL